jgi:predicted dehydrogenase
MPRRVRANMLSQAGTKNSKGTVPTEFSAELFFDKDTSASFYCSFITENQAWANVSGTKGYLRVDDFVLPFLGDRLSFEVFHSKFAVRGCDFEMTRGSRQLSVKEHANSARDAQETNLFRNFAAQVQSGKLNKDWPMWSLKTQQVMEACFASARQGRDVKL